MEFIQIRSVDVSHERRTDQIIGTRFIRAVQPVRAGSREWEAGARVWITLDAPSEVNGYIQLASVEDFAYYQDVLTPSVG